MVCSSRPLSRPFGVPLSLVRNPYTRWKAGGSALRSRSFAQGGGCPTKMISKKNHPPPSRAQSVQGRAQGDGTGSVLRDPRNTAEESAGSPPHPRPAPPRDRCGTGPPARRPRRARGRARCHAGGWGAAQSSPIKARATSPWRAVLSFSHTWRGATRRVDLGPALAARITLGFRVRSPRGAPPPKPLGPASSSSLVHWK